MPEVALEGTTGNEKVDIMLQATIGLCELFFPGRIRGYYVAGSYAQGTATSQSDIDFELVFKGSPDQEDIDKAMQLSDYCNRLNDQSGFSVRQEANLTPVGKTVLKLNSLFLYGDDLRGSLAMPDLDDYVWSTMSQGALFLTQRVRNGTLPLPFPVECPQPDDEFYGYVVGRTKDLLQSVFWMATGLIALKTGKYVAHRTAGLELYRRDIGDEWTEFLQQLYTICRAHYHPPKDPATRGELRNLGRQALAFENHFLGVYRSYLLSILRERPANPLAVYVTDRLSEIAFDDDEFSDALAAGQTTPSGRPGECG